MRIGLVLAWLFIASQVVLIGYSRFIPERFFCWAPFDEQTVYTINVVIDGDSLSMEEVEKRYRYSPDAIEPRAIDNIFSIVEQYEKTYGKTDNAKVSITYSTNGHPSKTWYYPQ